MPRGANRNRRQTSPAPVADAATVDVPVTESENDVTTTETDLGALPSYALDIEPMPEDYSPDRSPVGRSRTPSVYEDRLPSLKDKGWQKIRHDGTVVMEKTDSGQLKATPASVKTSDAHVIVRELRKAQQFLGLGMDLNITDAQVEFRIRDLQKRKAKEGEQADADGNVVDESDVAPTEYDSDETGE